MAFEKLIPMLYSQVLEETVAFYTSVLGFECEGLDMEAGWASVKKDQVEVMIAFPNDHLLFEKPNFTGSLYIKTNNVDQLWNELKDQTKVCYPIESFDYGMREFAIYDNNGYMIQFGQEINS